MYTEGKKIQQSIHTCVYISSVRRREEAQANLAEAKTVQDTMDQSERAARLQLDRAMLALREAEFAHRRVLEEAATAEETTRKIDERREECLRRTLRFAADKEAAEERFQKQKDALVSAQHEEKMIEKREMQTRHDEQKVRARIAARAETISDIADTTQVCLYVDVCMLMYMAMSCVVWVIVFVYMCVYVLVYMRVYLRAARNDFKLC
jgi:chromosome segregation ATPase